jgi:hypothetical protein
LVAARLQLAERDAELARLREQNDQLHCELELCQAALAERPDESALRAAAGHAVSFLELERTLRGDQWHALADALVSLREALAAQPAPRAEGEGQLARLQERVADQLRTFTEALRDAGALGGERC